VDQWLEGVLVSGSVVRGFIDWWLELFWVIDLRGNGLGIKGFMVVGWSYWVSGSYLI